MAGHPPTYQPDVRARRTSPTYERRPVPRTASIQRFGARTNLGRLGEQLLQSADALDDVLIAQGVGEPEVSARAEGLTRDDGDLGLLQDQGGQFGRGGRGTAAQRLAEQPLDRRVDVEGALRGGADHAGDVVQHPDDELAP